MNDETSISDLEKLMSGETPAPAAPAAEPPKPTPEPATAAEPEPVAAAAEPPAAEPEPKTEAEGSTAEPKQEPEPPKKESWFDKRLSSLSRQKNEAKELAEREHNRAEQLQRELEALKAQPGAQPPAADHPPAAIPAAGKAKPQLKDFEAALKDGEEYSTAVERYTDAVGDWRDEQRTLQQAREAQQSTLAAQEAVFKEDWKQSLEAIPDFEEIVGRVREATPEALQIAISQVQDPEGKNLWPQINVYLDEHPDELKTLTTQFAKNAYAGTARLGRIAAALSPDKPPAPKPQTQAPVVPKKAAPKPPVAVGGTAAPAVVDLETADLDTLERELQKHGIRHP